MPSFSVLMGEEWSNKLQPVLTSPQIQALGAKLVGQSITPKWDDVFNAYKFTQPSQLKVLILGQDPYPTPGHAHGLSFSSGNGTLPFSLNMIFKDLQLGDPEKRMRMNPDLTDWAQQGVMLLNSVLTTTPGATFAHKGWGWEYFVAQTLAVINALEQPYVVFAWGKAAQTLIDEHIKVTDKHLVLKAAHPANERYAPNSFIGSQHFYRANEFLQAHGIEPIKWI